MDTKTFAYIYLLGILGAYLARIPSVIYNSKVTSLRDCLSQSERMKREGYLLSTLMVLWFFFAQVFPMIYAFTHWITPFNYDLPLWAGYLGTGLFIILILLLWRAHFDLNRNWSAVVQIKEKQALVTDGIYHFIRHPIYTAHILWGIAQVLLIHNWLAGFSGFILIVLIMILRIPKEERLLIQQFGNDYRKYMLKTGALLPRLIK